MELFLLLSIGLSIVAFISIALNQAPPYPSVTNQSQPETDVPDYPYFHTGLETAFPLEPLVMTPEKMNVLKLKDQTVPNDFNVVKRPKESIKLPKPELSEELLLVASGH